MEAVREDYAAVLAEAEAGPPPEFSPRYRRRRLEMCNRPFAYYKKATRTLWRKALHSAACILLVAAVSLGAVMAVSPTARAWVQEVVSQWFQTHTRFVFTGSPNAGTETGAWKTGYLPEGFEIAEEIVGTQVTEVRYQNGEGETIYLHYMLNEGGASISVDNEHQGYVELQINGNSAYLMKAEEEGAWNNLIWTDDESGVAFKLMSAIDSRELIRMAESIIRTDL